MLVELFVRECRRLCEKSKVDVLICSPPQEMFAYADNEPVVVEGDESQSGELESEEEESEGLRTDFHDMLKAQVMILPKPIQMVRPATYDEDAKEMTRHGLITQRFTAKLEGHLGGLRGLPLNMHHVMWGSAFTTAEIGTMSIRALPGFLTSEARG